jgi:hypothetical protein
MWRWAPFFVAIPWDDQNNGGSDRRKDRQHFEARPENGADQNTNDYVDDH